VKKLVLCFDRARRYPGPDATNAARLFHLLDTGAGQFDWYHPGSRTADHRGRWNVLRWRERAADDARAAIAEAYEFLVDQWEPGDRIFMFGGGRGGYCAQTLTRLLATVGVLPDLRDYVLSAYSMPRTDRTQQDWDRVTQVTSQLAEQRQMSVPVWFLGLWDAMKIPGFTRRTMPDPMPNVVLGRHAVAIDAPCGERLVASASDRIEEVWFRGAHCDVAGGPRACQPLADITFEWMLDGAVRAGLAVSSACRRTAPAPSQRDALTETAHTVSMRKLPDSAALHASVDMYLREHPTYWRRLPAEVVWSDTEWSARSERLTPAKSTRAPAAEKTEVAAAAS
jgi:uncharacterized protein (DUF2235 family)